MRFLLITVLSSSAFAGCLPVSGNRILGRDLAAADPQFSELPSTLTVGFAPTPGTKRIYTAVELERIARANGIAVRDPAEICFELPMRQVGEEEVAAAMRRSLPADADLKLVELAKIEVPAGQLEFPIEGLEPPTPTTPGTQLWRGDVRYAETRKAAFWARVAVTVRYTAVIANRDLAANSVINANSLRMETRTGPLEREKIAARIEDVSGRELKRALKAGALIPLVLLADAPAVRRGDPVKVEVQSGPARIHFVALAENAANEGEMVELRNPLSGKTFRARLDPGARAVLIVPAGQGL